MRKIETTRQFEKDLKSRGLSAALIDVLHALIHNEPLPEKYRDHSLRGGLQKYRECHIAPDLLLAYTVDEDTVYLIALDNHNNLFKTLSKR